MPSSRNALDMLRRDHKQLQMLLHRFEKVDDEDAQRALCEQIVSGLKLHTEIEERVFYPYLREATAREDLFQEASIEHGLAKQLLQQLPKEAPGTPRLKAMMKVLADQVQHHVMEEENEIFPQVERTGVDLKALGEALEDARNGQPVDMGGAGGTKRARSARPNGHDQEGRRAPREDHERKAASQAKDETQGHAKVNGHAQRGKDARTRAADDERFVEEHAEGLSRSTQRAKWIHTPEDRPERDGQTLATRSLEVIKAWAEARGGRPATTAGGDTERPRVLRIDFPEYDESLQPLTWEAWGSTFEDRDLVFLFQETQAAGNQSNFFRLDSPHREDA